MTSITSINKHELKNTWYSMRARCSKPTDPKYKHYGGKGIMVCDRWSSSPIGFWNFVEDMGDRPKGHTLDRIDNNGNYEPSNCRWANRYEQGANMSKNNKTVGVCWHKVSKCWVAYIHYQDKRINLGNFKVYEDAVKARKDIESEFVKLVV